MKDGLIIYPKNFLTKRVRNLIERQIEVLGKNQKGLLLSIGGDSRSDANENETNVTSSSPNIQYLIKDAKEKLNWPVISVIEQNEKILVGNAAKILINGKNEFVVMESIAFQKNYLPMNFKIRFVSINSPIGKALLGKKVDDTSSYSIDEKKSNLKIVRIDPPSKIKWIFELYLNKEIKNLV